MNEFIQGMLGTLALVPSLVFGICSWFGGRDKNYLGIRARIWKRIIAPLFFILLLVGFSLLVGRFSWWFLLSIPYYIISSSLGYGGDDLKTKIIRRTIWSIVRSSCSLPVAIITGAWVLLIIQYFVGIIITLLLGILNSLKAPQEEFVINFNSVMYVPYMLL